MRSPSSLLTILAVLGAWPRAAHAQCQSTCPPLDGGGNPVSSLCAGDAVPPQYLSRSHAVCWPPAPRGPASLALGDYVARDVNGDGRVDGDDVDAAKGQPHLSIVVMALVFTGCNAGRREAEHFQDTATATRAAHPNVVFVSTLHGGGNCGSWAGTWAKADAATATTPLTIDDSTSALRDTFFTAPYPHPAYVVLDWEGRVRHKLVGPCCGYADYFACADATAAGLRTTLNGHIAALLAEIDALVAARTTTTTTTTTTTATTTPAPAAPTAAPTPAPTPVPTPAPTPPTAAPTPAPTPSDADCAVGAWGAWRACSLRCGGAGEQARFRAIAVPGVRSFSTLSIRNSYQAFRMSQMAIAQPPVGLGLA